jgi:ribosomal protein L11 methyltransferase
VGDAADADGTSAAGTWLELSVVADPEAVEPISAILARVAPGGIAIEPAFTTLQEGLATATDPAAPATVRAYLPGADRAGAAGSVAQVRRDLGHLQAFGLRAIGDLQVRVVQEEDWAAAWKRHFPVLRVGRRLVVRPPWRRYRGEKDDVVLVVDPGMAFGTGLHPTTRLCLAALEHIAQRGGLRGARVLDVGSGSGILAIGAAKLGAWSVLAVDTDPIAVEASVANVRRNRLVRTVHVRQGTIRAADGPFDVVVANLVASLLVELAERLYEAVRPGSGSAGSGGVLVCSGIIDDREPEVRRALAAAGFRIRGRFVEGDWVALEAERIQR